MSSPASPSKVLLVGDFPPPNGGVATHVEELFRAVRAQGGECDVLDIGKGQLPADGVVPAGGVARFTALLAGYAARGFQVHVHTSGANPKSWALAGICAAAGVASGQPSIITFHSGLGPAWLAESDRRKLLARTVASRFGKVIAVSDEIRRTLLDCGVPESRIEVLAAFSHRFLQPGPPPPGLAAVRDGAAPLFSAMLAPGKVYGQELLLEAFAKVRAAHPQARLALYGPGCESVRAEGVHAFGELHRKSALALMAASDVFIRPTLADGDSVSVREALALGRIVVASNVGNRPPGVRLVAPGDASALAHGLTVAAAELQSVGARPPAPPAADSFQAILAFYGFAPPAQATPGEAPEAPACVASAAS